MSFLDSFLSLNISCKHGFSVQVAVEGQWRQGGGLWRPCSQEQTEGPDSFLSRCHIQVGLSFPSRSLWFSREITTNCTTHLRHRHLLNDLASLLPHSRKDTKFDSKSKLWLLNENALLQNCNNIMFFEARKGKDLYMHLSSSPNGPTCKFYVQNRKYNALMVNPDGQLMRSH